MIFVLPLRIVYTVVRQRKTIFNLYFFLTLLRFFKKSVFFFLVPITDTDGYAVVQWRRGV